MPDESTSIEIQAQSEGPDISTALRMLKRRKRKIFKAKKAADEIAYLNIVAMMDMMTIILVFLLKNISFSAVAISGTEALQLPFSTTTQPIIEAAKIFVTKNEIVVEGKLAAKIDKGTIPDEYLSKTNKYLIPPLRELLAEEVKRQLILEQTSNKLKFQGNLLILADKDTPYHIIMQILFTAGQAKAGPDDNPVTFGNFRFTVLITTSN